jgi:putative endonuclease
VYAREFGQFHHNVTLPLMLKQSYFYVLASGRNGTLYTGVTANLVKRVWQHRSDTNDGFTQRYCVHLLVYFEVFADIREAILREKRVKKWRREWKLDLIEQGNPSWSDLYPSIAGGGDELTEGWIRPSHPGFPRSRE